MAKRLDPGDIDEAMSVLMVDLISRRDPYLALDLVDGGYDDQAIGEAFKRLGLRRCPSLRAARRLAREWQDLRDEAEREEARRANL